MNETEKTRAGCTDQSTASTPHNDNSSTSTPRLEDMTINASRADRGELETTTAKELLEMPLAEVAWVVEGLLANGLTVLAGPPKAGKSWLVLLLVLCVSRGLPFWEHATIQGDVLYLCLEDTIGRIQQRLFRITDEANDRLYFSVSANSLHDGLLDQLESFVASHPRASLIVIDTLQTIRSATRDNAYAADYGDLGMLKRFADEHELAILVVHHTRKAGDSDVLNTVSGTNGITGSADATMLLARETRYGGEATLTVTGRDIDYAEYRCRFHDCIWKLIEKTSAEELEERDVPGPVMSVLDFMAGNPAEVWEGTATKLLEEINDDETKSNVLSKWLNQFRDFMTKRGVSYSCRRTSTTRTLRLQKVTADDANDGNSGTTSAVVISGKERSNG